MPRLLTISGEVAIERFRQTCHLAANADFIQVQYAQDRKLQNPSAIFLFLTGLVASMPLVAVLCSRAKNRDHDGPRQPRHVGIR